LRPRLQDQLQGGEIVGSKEIASYYQKVIDCSEAGLRSVRQLAALGNSKEAGEILAYIEWVLSLALDCKSGLEQMQASVDEQGSVDLTQTLRLLPDLYKKQEFLAKVLKGEVRRRGRPPSTNPPTDSGEKLPSEYRRGRGRPPMNATERREVSERMRKYWSGRRAKNAPGGDPGPERPSES
jgi:hypothetical protein